MSYKITITNPGNHITNPLLTLADREYETREEACEAIYAALYDVIDGDNGCEMIKKVAPQNTAWLVCDNEEWCNSAMLFRANDVPTRRQFAVAAGFDNSNDLPDDPLPTCPLDDYIWDLDDQTPNNMIIDTDEQREAVEKAIRERDAYRGYGNVCHDYILREGYASEDGVSATVTEA